ncbi:putative RPN1-26S proteasome regulatory subunit [Jaminaea rosea]|uniref:26S proteasome regulatory subunit RPN1 n=1 Tax=Jaminaea rosea TaxID=1569628 RepID=A0A316US43_9BASI|nr:putative RPN1-26S proteasome regulatory subunit [Jaminaea rosea]PWN27804.1 putative RPN1-26S proteasome regulatory subunit [Jaminaea rosea]
MPRGDEDAAAQRIVVPSDDPVAKKKKDDDVDVKDNKDKANGRIGKDGKPIKEEEISEEDLQLKNELEMLVERLGEGDKKLYKPALESLRTLIRTSTSSMTSVPKPLKFLRPHYNDLKKTLESWPSQSVPAADQSLFAEILSVLAMTYADNGNRETLKYRLQASHVGGKQAEDPGLWGNEYVRHLAAEIGEEYNARVDDDKETSELVQLGLLLVPFSLKHNAEADAVDLLLELESIEKLPPYVEQETFARVCLYMVSCSNLLVPPDDVTFLRTAHEIYRKHNRFSEALVLALRLGDRELIRSDFEAPRNPVMKKQLALLLGRQQVPIEWLQASEDEPLQDQELIDCIFNTKLSENFIQFGKELSVYEPRSLEDIYKSHLESGRQLLGPSVDSARGNLASAFVNAFVNAGFGNDKLMVDAEEGKSWIWKTKDHGQLSATGSLGMSLLWDTEGGLGHIDKYSYSDNEHVRAGALLAYGILHASVRTEMDAALALLSEHVESSNQQAKISAIVGLGIAYAGSQREDIMALLIGPIADETVPMEVASMAALALGFIFVGSAHGEITPTILQSMMEREPSHLDHRSARFMILGLALLFLQKQDESDATIETLKAIEHPLAKQAQVLVDACSYAGNGDVLKIQQMLHHCTEHIGVDEDKKDKKEGEDGAGADAAAGANGEQANAEEKDATPSSDTFQGFAVLGIGLIAMGEEVGAEMVLRHMSHLMHYGEPVIRRAVPLALALLQPSNPQMALLDTLSKYSHDSDLDVAINSIFALGIVAAGTNNARVGQLLRGLASYYHKEPDTLFVVRIAQGLVGMGKGTINLNPFHSDRQLMSRTSVAGLLATLMAFTDSRGTILDKGHWMLYFLANAMWPRWIVTVDEELNRLPVAVRVGKAVDVVGQAGKPRTISGFQTHTAPVRLGTIERAELASEEYLAFSHILEGIVVLRKNPGYSKEE